MKKSEIETLTLPDGSRITGYKNECVFEDIRRHNTYFEKDMLDKWFLPRVDEISCVYDIGANLGNHTVYFATHAKKANVFSFEPVPITFELLKKNVEQNGLSDRVTLFQYALGAQEGNARMQVSGTNTLSLASITEKGTQEVAVKRLDDLNLPPPDFVKIDVEDYELEVLKGMKRTLRESSPVLWIEIHAGLENNQEKYEFLSSLGYIPTDCVLPSNILFANSDVCTSKTAKQFCAFIMQAHMCIGNEKQYMKQRIKASYERSRSYKLGRAITAPLRALRDVFRRR